MRLVAGDRDVANVLVDAQRHGHFTGRMAGADDQYRFGGGSRAGLFSHIVQSRGGWGKERKITRSPPRVSNPQKDDTGATMLASGRDKDRQSRFARRNDLQR